MALTHANFLIHLCGYPLNDAQGMRDASYSRRMIVWVRRHLVQSSGIVVRRESVHKPHRRSLIGCDEQTFRVASPEKKKPTHNPEDPATEKSRLVSLNEASADNQSVVPLIVEVIENVPLDEEFLIVEFRRGQETRPTAPEPVDGAVPVP